MKFVLAVPAVFGLLAAAAAPPPVSQCNTGTPKCCKNVGAASSGPISALLKPLNVVLDDPTAIVGLDCTPLTLVGGGKGADCVQQPVCCKDVKSNGVPVYPAEGGKLCIWNIWSLSVNAVIITENGCLDVWIDNQPCSFEFCYFGWKFPMLTPLVDNACNETTPPPRELVTARKNCGEPSTSKPCRLWTDCEPGCYLRVWSDRRLEYCANASDTIVTTAFTVPPPDIRSCKILGKDHPLPHIIDFPIVMPIFPRTIEAAEQDEIGPDVESLWDILDI
ncbi:hypothetical protein BU17DRAFT_64875 [Hysterangium stoloniferum]|nr:hypothetical protein BU17DRAFT_64875 [Hysterangium stoloniferum]